MAEQVTLSLDGQRYDGWKDVAITRSLDSLVGSFDMTLTDRERTGDSPWPLRAGARCTIAIDGEQLIDGYIDKLSPSIDAEGHDIQITGRDKAADMVDASATNKPGSWTNVTMQQIAEDLASPFGVSIDFAADAGPKIKKWIGRAHV